MSFDPKMAGDAMATRSIEHYLDINNNYLLDYYTVIIIIVFDKVRSLTKFNTQVNKYIYMIR